jgi:hypothetical protein
MDTTTLKQILLDEMQKYTGEGLNDVTTLTINEAAQMYAVIDVAQIRNKRVVGAGLVATHKLLAVNALSNGTCSWRVLVKDAVWNTTTTSRRRFIVTMP